MNSEGNESRTGEEEKNEGMTSRHSHFFRLPSIEKSSFFARFRFPFLLPIISFSSIACIRYEAEYLNSASWHRKRREMEHVTFLPFEHSTVLAAVEGVHGNSTAGWSNPPLLSPFFSTSAPLEAAFDPHCDPSASLEAA